MHEKELADDNKKVFTDLAIYMIGFGVVIGIVFPFFVLITGVPASLILTPLFFFLCIAAGFIVGMFNIFLATKIVGNKLAQLSSHMKYVEHRLTTKTATQDTEECTDEKCYTTIDSKDSIGECAQAFNALVNALAKAFKSENSVRNFTEMLSSRLELDKLSEEALKTLMGNLNAEGGAIIIEKEGDLHVLSSHGIKTPEAMLESDMIWKAFKDEKRLVVELPQDILLNALLVDFRPKTILFEPIIYKDVILGAVILAGVNSFSVEMMNKMGLFGNGLALALRNAITHDQLQKLAANDPLTGIFNRRFGLTRLKDELNRAIRNKTPIGVLMLDIDHFKKVNDTYGHLVGDKVLVSLSQTAKSALREGDVFLRYGGEEFLVILPGASQADVLEVSEKLRHLIEDTEIRHKEQVIRVTVSLGGTSYPEHDTLDMNALIHIADQKLYQAKELGRNMSIVD